MKHTPGRARGIKKQNSLAVALFWKRAGSHPLEVVSTTNPPDQQDDLHDLFSRNALLDSYRDAAATEREKGT